MTLDLTYGALADPSRRAMLRLLATQTAATVSELAAPLPIGLPTVMKHLEVLTRAGLIARHKTGRTVTVTLVPGAMEQATAWLAEMEDFWTARLDRLVTVVEKEQP